MDTKGINILFTLIWIEKVKVLVEGCLTDNGITGSIEAILKSGDPEQMKPICL
jgi:hypothetical protein